MAALKQSPENVNYCFHEYSVFLFDKITKPDQLTFKRFFHLADSKFFKKNLHRQLIMSQLYLMNIQ